MKKLLTLSLLIITAFSCNTEKPQQELKNEILWDTWGIPHIYASSDYELYKMAGWSQMKNHGNLVLKLYGESRGKSAEYWGYGLERDKSLHTLGLVDNSKKAYEGLSEKEKVVLDAFADGINHYASSHPEEIDENYKVVLPVSPVDVMAHSFRVFYLEFLINAELQQLQYAEIGSNAWAANGSKTQGDKSLLLANPHLPWFDFWLFFEAQYITPENNLYGATLVGLPSIGIGFNEHLGWTHTVNTLDNVDFYSLDMDNESYEIDGTQKSLVIDSVLLKSQGDDGMNEEWLIRKRSDHGYIVKESGDKAVAIRYPNMDGSMNIYQQWNAMGRASSLGDFEKAMTINTIPLFNTLYADTEGNILYHFAGNVPEKRGDWDKWQGIVSGDSSADIWTSYYDYNEVPHLLNPENGWIQNANDPPFTNTIPTLLDPQNYASHIAPNSMSFRPQRSANLIKGAEKLTLQDMINLKHDTHSEMALRLKDDISQLKDQTEDSLTLAAIEVIDNWDGTFDADSKGTILFISLTQAFGDMDNVFSEPWSFDKPVSTPDGIKDGAIALEALKGTAAYLLENFQSLEISYGDVFRTQVGSYDFPANGGFGHLGLFRTVAFDQRDDGKFYAFHGDSFVCAMEFDEKVTAKALLSYGNATQPNSPHVGDQLELFSKKELRDVWYSREDQESNLELLETLDEVKKSE